MFAGKLIKLAILYLVVLAILAFSQFLLSSYFPIEEAQQILYPLIIIIIFLITKFFKIKIPQFIFIFSIVIWVVLLSRVNLMMKFGFFDGRVIIGKFEDDSRGYKARELHKSLKTIATTYHLPGPVLLPVRYRSEVIQPKDELGNYSNNGSIPALLVFGSSKFYDIRFPYMEYVDFKNCTSSLKDRAICDEYSLPFNTRFLFFHGSEGLTFAVPALPANFLIEREPEFAVNHLISWLSAYFSPQINSLADSREDVLSEAARIKSLPIDGRALSLARLILSYEQLLSTKFESMYDRNIAKKRLLNLIKISRSFHDSEIYGISLNLLALIAINDPEEFGTFVEAKKILSGIIYNNKVSLQQRQIASYNLSIISLF